VGDIGRVRKETIRFPLKDPRKTEVPEPVRVPEPEPVKVPA
jgi:hypothetical protein